MAGPYKEGLKFVAAATVNQVNDMPAPETSFDTVQLADRLRPVLLRVGRELRREAREVGVSPHQVTLMVAIKYEPGIGVRALAGIVAMGALYIRRRFFSRRPFVVGAPLEGVHAPDATLPSVPVE